MMPRARQIRALVTLLTAAVAAGACDSASPDPPVINNSPPTAEAGGPYAGVVGQPTILDGSGSRDGEGAIARYDWTIEDGVPTRLTGVQPEYICVAEGTFNLTLTVRDSNDAPDSDAGEITCVVQNLVPTAVTGGPYTFRVGVAGTLDGSGSSDPDGEILDWSWAIGDAGSTVLDGETVDYTCATQGTFDVTLTVTDDAGNMGSADTTVECVQNVPPTAVTGGPYSVRIGDRAFLDGRGSSDLDGSVVSYRWTVADGGPTVLNGSTVFYDCTVPASYDLTLMVTDNEGATGTETTTLACVANVPPVADPGGPYSAEVGQSVTLDGSDSDDPDGRIVSWTWSVADPPPPTVLNGETVSYACTVGGTFSATLTVADNEGGTHTASTTVECIPNQPPVARSGGPYSGRVGRDVPLDGGASTDADGSIVAYEWSVDDGGSPTILTGSAATYSCAVAGTYDLTLTVTDDDGATGSATTSLACVANVPPVADPGGPYQATVGTPVTLDGSGSEDPDGTIASYTWIVADDGSPTILTDAMPSYSCDGTGTFAVTLTVADNDGATDNAGTQIVCTAANVAPTADAGGPYNGAVDGDAVDFDGTGSSDTDGTIVDYEWSVVDGGAPSILSGSQPSYDCETAGTFQVTLTVTDDDGATDEDQTSVTCAAANQAPTADAGGPYSGPVTTSVAFNGTGSSDPEGGLLTYAWSVADGGEPTVLTGATPSYLCGSDATTYPVTLTVTDNGGLTAEDGTTVECTAPANSAPTVAFTLATYNGTTGADVTVTANASDTDGSIAAIDFDLDDNGSYETAGSTGSSTAQASFQCVDVGTFDIGVRATDDDGAFGFGSAEVVCAAPANTPPTVAFANEPYGGTTDGGVTITANASDPDAGDAISAIDFDFDGDGIYEVTGTVVDGSAQVTFTCPADAGTYAIGVRATDTNAGEGFDTGQVECTAPDPTNVRVDFLGADGGSPPQTAPEFSDLSYRVRVENTSAVLAENVALTVTIDPDATGVSASDLEADGNVWSGTRPSIAPGEVWDVLFSLTVEDRRDSPHLSLAEVSAPLDPDGKDSDNQARLRIRIVDDQDA
ncbi:MAG TPA: PKD domain-containing protein [Longimicrobiales bacterium]|nr:PKD domain-containing protein [Longimicrobiales bacterium]